MKTANSFVTLAVLGFAACLAPSVNAQANAPQEQKPQAQSANAHQNHPANKAPMAHAASTPVKHAAVKPNASRPTVAVKHAAVKPNVPRPTVAVKHAMVAPNASRPAIAVKHAEVKPNTSRPVISSHRPNAPRMAQTARKPETHKPVHTAVVRKPVHPPVAVAHTPVVSKSAAAAQPPAVAVEPVISRRDPFAPLIQLSAGGKATGEHLPPGVGGLVVATVRVDGTVEAPSGMLAVVSNPDDRIYFIRAGDRLYDGDVEKISLDGVTFKENSKDAFGKPVERLVTKRIYPSAGE